MIYYIYVLSGVHRMLVVVPVSPVRSVYHAVYRYTPGTAGSIGLYDTYEYEHERKLKLALVPVQKEGIHSGFLCDHNTEAELTLAPPYICTHTAVPGHLGRCCHMYHIQQPIALLLLSYDMILITHRPDGSSTAFAYHSTHSSPTPRKKTSKLSLPGPRIHNKHREE